MKKTALIFFQVVIILVAVAGLIILIRFPVTEGRVRNLTLFSIYFNPFIIYGYGVSIVLFSHCFIPAVAAAKFETIFTECGKYETFTLLSSGIVS